MLTAALAHWHTISICQKPKRMAWFWFWAVCNLLSYILFINLLKEINKLQGIVESCAHITVPSPSPIAWPLNSSALTFTSSCSANRRHTEEKCNWDFLTPTDNYYTVWIWRRCLFVLLFFCLAKKNYLQLNFNVCFIFKALSHYGDLMKPTALLFTILNSELGKR